MTELTSEQGEVILAATNRKSNLRELHIGFTELSTLHPQLIARAATNLKELNIKYIEMTTEQAEAVFTTIIEKSKLKILDIEGNCLSSVETTC